MHWKDAKAVGESDQRLYGLDAWREAPYYTDRERAALEWIEALTLVTEGHVPDDVYERARRQFSDKELVELSMIAVAINGWNRLAIAFRAEAGAYQPSQHQAGQSRAAAVGPASRAAGPAGIAPREEP